MRPSLRRRAVPRWPQVLSACFSQIPWAGAVWLQLPPGKPSRAGALGERPSLRLQATVSATCFPGGSPSKARPRPSLRRNVVQEAGRTGSAKTTWRISAIVAHCPLVAQARMPREGDVARRLNFNLLRVAPTTRPIVRASAPSDLLETHAFPHPRAKVHESEVHASREKTAQSSACGLQQQRDGLPSRAYRASHRRAARSYLTGSFSAYRTSSRNASSKLRFPTSRALASAATRLPCSIALEKMALGCPCAVTTLPEWGRTADLAYVTQTLPSRTRSTPRRATTPVPRGQLLPR
jgi:hypothetical protein